MCSICVCPKYIICLNLFFLIPIYLWYSLKKFFRCKTKKNNTQNLKCSFKFKECTLERKQKEN